MGQNGISGHSIPLFFLKQSNCVTVITLSCASIKHTLDFFWDKLDNYGSKEKHTQLT